MTSPALPAKPFALAHGSHSTPQQGACFNELASVLAGEPFSDSPACVSPLVRRLGMSLNDRLDDERRQLLRPFVLRSLGTADDGREEERRQMCNEWLLHQTLPRLLDAAGRKEAATRLRELPADLAVKSVRKAIWQARDEAWEARRTAREELRDRIRAELAKRGYAVDPAVGAVAAAAAAAVAVDVIKSGKTTTHGEIDEAVREKVAPIVRPKVRELCGPILPSALDLLDRMLPQSPVLEALAVPLEDARVICGVGEAV